ncbi:mitochondrial inner membrane protease ATP23 homolog [Melitaea cinxia]|uniref:mitochondrial inner membrane protease ATP23 homolog n=1 Tax=Melitaea cinxia TaxID=113334 RepID=UPI001E274207|nr:mitochondrial inner membrane protease ATP23 homolog [Melitaea cinxia]XP_045445423.1 mitochondrial inner membrane protease ATP23 homolog [Melitaea cinxia]
MSNNNEETSAEKQDSNNNTNNEKKEAWGYDLYPERRGTFKPKITNVLIGKEGKEGIEKIKCEKNVYKCIKESPIVKVMLAALRSSGCPVDIRRHISCEVCDYSVSGGYDPQLNQIVVCQNVSTRKGMVQGVLTHEMIHMFDYCRNELDFRNMEHLACTEIRAANLTHCSFTSAWSQGDASFLKIKEAHQDCVKTKALYSVLAVRQIGKAEAVDIIEKVFPKCYNDLEPIGRRIRRNSEDMTRAYREASYYGYE